MEVAIIGNGYWGKTYLKTLEKIPDVNVGVCTYNYKDLFKDSLVDCIIIATPAETHFQIAKDCLEAGKHILVEKPFTTNSKNCNELRILAENKNLILQIGHIYLYHEGIKKIKEIIDSGILGDIESIYSERTSTSHIFNALWDMGTHDIYIFDYFFSKYVAEEKYALGDVSNCIYSIEYTKVLYEPYIREHKIKTYVHTCSYSPVKRREMIINGNKKRLLFDDQAPIYKLLLVDKKTKESKHIEFDTLITPLEKQCKHFFDCINNKEKPKAGIHDGFKNVKSLEILEKML